MGIRLSMGHVERLDDTLGLDGEPQAKAWPSPR